MKSIINFEQKHILECSNLYIKVFNAEPWCDNWTLETAYKRLNDIYHSRNFVGLLFVEEGQIKGAILGNYEQFYDGRHYNLREMFVSTQLQGTGIGSEMLDILEEKLIELGITTIILFTSKGNKTSMFYSKNGFCEWSSMVMMGKEIQK